MEYYAKARSRCWSDHSVSSPNPSLNQLSPLWYNQAMLIRQPRLFLRSPFATFSQPLTLNYCERVKYFYIYGLNDDSGYSGACVKGAMRRHAFKPPCSQFFPTVKDVVLDCKYLGETCAEDLLHDNKTFRILYVLSVSWQW